MALNARRIRFVQEFCVDFNGTQSAIRAGYGAESAAQTAYELLRNPEIQAAIEERKEELAAVAEINAAWVLRQWKQIASADANELTQLRRINCRHCHGYDFKFQWTEAQYMSAVDQAIERGKEPPDGMGGFGFDINREPNPECPECGGIGVEHLFVADTRKLKGNAKRLYAGVQKTKDGLKVLTRDQDAALANISRYLGMVVDKKEISGPGGGPVPLAHITADDLTDAQLAALIQAEDATDDKQE